MSKEQKKKLCWNCEGNVSVNTETCPFCGVSVVPASLDGNQPAFTPPYRMGSNAEPLIPASPYAIKEDNNEVEGFSDELKIKDTEVEPPADEFKRAFVAAALLLTGSVFFLFSIALALFSHNDMLVLKWDGSIWFIYTMLALPLLYFGWRSLMQLDSDR